MKNGGSFQSYVAVYQRILNQQNRMTAYDDKAQTLVSSWTTQCPLINGCSSSTNIVYCLLIQLHMRPKSAKYIRQLGGWDEGNQIHGKFEVASDEAVEHIFCVVFTAEIARKPKVFAPASVGDHSQLQGESTSQSVHASIYSRVRTCWRNNRSSQPISAPCQIRVFCVVERTVAALHLELSGRQICSVSGLSDTRWHEKLQHLGNSSEAADAEADRVSREFDAARFRRKRDARKDFWCRSELQSFR